MARNVVYTGYYCGITNTKTKLEVRNLEYGRVFALALAGKIHWIYVWICRTGTSGEMPIGAPVCVSTFARSRSKRVLAIRSISANFGSPRSTTGSGNRKLCYFEEYFAIFALGHGGRSERLLRDHAVLS